MRMSAHRRRQAEIAVKRQIARVLESRRDPNAYIEYTTKVPPQNPKIDRSPRWARQDPIHREIQGILTQHDRVVLLAPTGIGKTTQVRKRLEWEIGVNPNTVVKYVSASESLPKNVLAAMQQEMTTNMRVRDVFPHLRKATLRDDGREAWNSKSLLVPRSMPLVDPTMQIFGLFGNVLGGRTNIVVLDDIINMITSLTENMRDKVYNWLSEIVTRLQPGSQVWSIGHIWDERDALQRLAKNPGWVYRRYECLVVDRDRVRKNARVRSCGPDASINHEDEVGQDVDRGEDDVDVDVDIQPHTMTKDEIRSRAAVGEIVSLAPTVQTVEDILTSFDDLHGNPVDILRMKFNRLPGDLASRFREQWFIRCLELGRGLINESNHTGFRSSWDGGEGMTYTGVDLGHRKEIGKDRTVMVTAAVLPNAIRQIIDVRSGLWKGDEILANIERVHADFGSIMCVENNNAQNFILDFAEYLTCVPARPHNTGAVNKHDLSHGVEAMGNEIRQGKWILPCDENLVPSHEVAQMISGCRTWNPATHTSDYLMAWWILKEGIRLSPSARALDADPIDWQTRM